jgi:hypothetical protein
MCVRVDEVWQEALQPTFKRVVYRKNGAKEVSISRTSPAGDRRPSCFPKTRRGGSRREYRWLGQLLDHWSGTGNFAAPSEALKPKVLAKAAEPHIMRARAIFSEQ